MHTSIDRRLPLRVPAVCRLGWIAFLFACLVPAAAFGAFGYTDNGTAFVVDTGAGLVFQVNKSSGDITSIVFNGTEYKGPSGKGSHIASGLGTTGTTVTAATDNSTYVKITLQTDASNTVVANFTHYLIVKNGINTIYMASYATAEPGVGEMRWITRLAASLIPTGPAPSNTGGGTAIESTDVFGLPDGTTRSKYYGDTVTNGKVRAMDLTYCGASGPGIGCWMAFGNRESSSGGPFFRDIENQYGGSVNTSDQEIYNYMNSGHEQTEAWRVNVLHGPYALMFTTGAAPTLPVDYSFMGSLGLTGWVAPAGRGTVSGTVSGIPAGFQIVVGLANTSAQYWGVASGGTYSIAGVKPGTYTATLYKGELSVATGSVNVSAGATSTLNLTSTETTPSTVFKIGEWDGTPSGFLNADKIVQMHPSDVRMSTWAPMTFTVGTTPVSSFPAIQFRGQNTPTTISFTLTASQIVDLTLRIGITCAYNNGRPQIGVNTWTSTVPAASSQPNSRSFTVGTWRGNNTTFTYTIPATALVVGTNSMTITPASGSADLSPWLSAGWVYDCVELDGPSSAPPPPPPAPTGLSATAVSTSQINLSWTASSGATGYNVKRATVSGGPYTTVATGVSATTYNDTGLAASTTYYYVVSATNSGGESGNSTQASATTQAPTPPPAPTGLTATAASSSQINLSWTAASGATGYNVKRASVSGGPYTTIATGVTATTFNDTGLAASTTYYYVVSATNANGESPNSLEASATTQAPPAPPPAPTGLTATAVSSSQINLSWTAASGATGYNVKRASVSGGPYTTIATGVTATTFNDTGLAASTTYYYVVSATNANGESPNSLQASATTQAPPAIPPAPTGLTATGTKRKVTLTWNASTGATSYNVKRAGTTGGPYTTIATGVTTTTYVNSGLNTGTTYYYVVSAVNSSGESPNSTEASATAK